MRLTCNAAGEGGGVMYVTIGMSPAIGTVVSTLALTGSSIVAHSVEHGEKVLSVCGTIPPADATMGTLLTAVGSPVHVAPVSSPGFGPLSGSVGVAVSLASTTLAAACLIEESSCTAFNESCEVLHVSGALKRKMTS